MTCVLNKCGNQDGTGNRINRKMSCSRYGLTNSHSDFTIFFFKSEWVLFAYIFLSKKFDLSMAIANLNKTEKLVTNTTTASKYMPKMPRICINGNPPFRTSLHKTFKNCFLWSKFYFTMLTFRRTFNKKIWVWQGEFQMMQILELWCFGSIC